jgi:uncharacterized protein involved in outer membrane biogenesis
MPRLLIIAGAVVGALVLAVAAVLIYAVTNLDALIERNREFILSQAGNSLGRTVEVREIRAALGWGVMMDLDGVIIGDDPDFSQRPFLVADNVYARVELFPLLARELRATELTIHKPRLRIIRARDGKLNVSTIGRRPDRDGAARPPRDKPEPEAGAPITAGRERDDDASALGAGVFLISRVAIDGGTLEYLDEERGGEPIVLRSVDLNVRDVSLDSPLAVTLRAAALGEQRNIDLSGRVGPIATNGSIATDRIPLALDFVLGPVELATLRKLPAAAGAIPKELKVTGPVATDGSVSGTVGSPRVNLNLDLTDNELRYGETFAKPAGFTFTVVADGGLVDSKLDRARANLVLGGAQIAVSDVSLDNGATRATVKTNRFDIESLATVLPALVEYQAKGKAEADAKLRIAGGKTDVDGVVRLENVALLYPGQKTALLSGLSGAVRMSRGQADVGPLKFRLGTSDVTLSARASSLSPLAATYDLKADALEIPELVPDRKAHDEHLNQLAARGSLSMANGALRVATDATSSSGNLANIAYNGLQVSAALAGDDLNIRSLNVRALGGSLAAAGSLALSDERPFDLTLEFERINLTDLLASQKSDAAEMVRGIATGRVQASGVGSGFETLKPRLRGGGRLAVADGKLIGVNVVADGLRRVENVPGIGALVPTAVVQNHPRLFLSPDTDISSATLSFELHGNRATSRDIVVESPDYRVNAQGWFSLERKVELAAQVLVSEPLSSEIHSHKKNVVYLTNRQGEIVIPLEIKGTLPKVRVVPDARDIAQRAGERAIQREGEKAVQKFLEKKGLGGLLGGGKESGGEPAAEPTPSEDPLAPLLRKLF